MREKEIINLKRLILAEYENAINFKLGSNGKTNGIWFELENTKERIFKPI